ncbi:sialin-like [Melitaea cinxia]|uniref:sialin-like n=1 Tax=Melitaea cinxia TaxID=113334 RepID=UPI001E27055E|nr:sialin-like [Melitaea cinxia]
MDRTARSEDEVNADAEPKGCENEEPGSYGLGYRHIQALLMFICLTFEFIMSAHAGVTIVAMSRPQNTTDEIVTSQLTSQLNRKFEKNETHDVVRYSDIYQLKSILEIILGSFFLGTAVMMFPISLLGQRFGGKVLLQISLAVNAVTSTVAPWLIAWGGWISFAVLRFLQGGVQAGLYPGIQFLVTQWFPVSERNSLSSFIYAGSGIGCMLAFLLAGVLADSKLGYPKLKVPWKKIFTSIPLWATVIAHVGNSVAFLFFFIQVPSYMVGVLNFNIMNSGILTALPYLGSCIAALAFGNLSDYLTNRQVISMKMARIIFNSIAICLIIVTYTHSSILAVVCFVIFSTTNSGHHFGWMGNYMDLSPNYCGSLMSIGNIISNLLGIVLPIITSFVVTDMTNRYQWRILLLLMAGCTFLSNVIFVIFMSADIQPWNKGDEEEEEEV